ncbi:MAG: fibronectin type III domain-containing protein [Euryarchaeota archaeon]|nr:fibronectin type III domain-containing protein [Euryarchaeota archaeon]
MVRSRSLGPLAGTRVFALLLLVALLLPSLFAIPSVGSPPRALVPRHGPVASPLTDAVPGAFRQNSLTSSSAGASPLLGAYDPSALLVPVGGTRALYPEAFDWSGVGAALAFGANLTWSVAPPSLGSVSSGGNFAAGALPGNGTITVVATWNGTSATNQVSVVVYAPACVLLSLDLPSRLLEEAGSNLSVSPRLLDQTGSTCPWAIPPVAWTLSPAGFGEITTSAGATVSAHVAATAGDGWLNASTLANGTWRNASLEISVPPSSAGVALHVFPQSASLRPGDVLPLSVSASDGWGVAPSGSFTWTLSPSSLGTLVPSGGSATFAARGPGGSGWINVSLTSGPWGTLRSSVTVVVSGPAPSVTLTGLYSPTISPAPLFPGQGVALSVEGVDQYGGLYPGAVNVSWSVHPSGLGRLVGGGTQVVFVAGTRPMNGSVLAAVNRTGGAPLSIPIPLTVLAPAVNSVALFGGPSDHVAEGATAYLEGVDQDLFGNLLLAGGYYGLEYPQMNVSWSVLPTSLGTVSPQGSGGPRDLPELGVFKAGSTPGVGVVEEKLQWGGERQTVSFPIVVDARVPSALAVASTPSVTPYGGVFENAPVPLSALVLDQYGDPVGAPGNFSWQLAPGSDGGISGSSWGSSLEITAGSAPGWVEGNVTWTYGGRTVVGEFLFDVVEPPSTASMIAITANGASAVVEAVQGTFAMETWAMGVTVVPGGTIFTVGTTQVPGALGPVSWSISPSSLGAISNGRGREVNVTLTGNPAAGWLNASVLGPGGIEFLASTPIFTYVPTLAYVQDLTGPCLGSCSLGLATLSGNNAYVALAPFDQLGRPFSFVSWSSHVSPSSLASSVEGRWVGSATSELFEVQANASAGNGTLSVRASYGSENATFSLPIEVVPSDLLLAPGAVGNVTATQVSETWNITWEAPTDLGSGRIVNYTLEVEPPPTPGGAAATTFLTGVYSTGASTQWVLSGLLPGTTYQVRVRAWNSVGLSGPWSPWVSFTTVAAPPRVLPWTWSWTSGWVAVSAFLVALATVAFVLVVREVLRREEVTPPRSGASLPSEGRPPPPRDPGGPGIPGA